MAAEKEESRNIRRRGDFLERELHDIREQLEKQVSAHEEAQRMKSKFEVKSESRSYIYYVDKFVLRPLLLYCLLSFWGLFMLRDGLILYLRQSCVCGRSSSDSTWQYFCAQQVRALQEGERGKRENMRGDDM